jgi:FixJ family two-component response regulator
MADTIQPTNILVADDDQGLLRLIEKTLRRDGHKPTTVVSGDLALAWIEKNPVELVLLDLGMPGMEGSALASKLAMRVPRVPFVVITGQNDALKAVAMMKQGALDYVVKDAQFLDFLPSVVRRALAQVERDRRLATAEAELRQLNAELEQRVRDRTADLQATNQRLEEALLKVRTLTGLLPTCAHCKRIRDESGQWQPIELYITQRSEASFSHGLCPECLKKHYPDVAAEVLLKASQRSPGSHPQSRSPHR